MSVRRFIGYFIALSACATIAFASSLLDHAPGQEVQNVESVAASSFMPHLPYTMPHFPLHKNGPKHLLVALAQ